MPVSLSDAVSADAEPLSRILGEWNRTTPWMPKLHSPADDLGFLAAMIRSHLVRVLRIDGVPAGFLARRGGEVDALYLAAHARGRGFGTALIREAQATERSGQLSL